MFHMSQQSPKSQQLVALEVSHISDQLAIEKKNKQEDMVEKQVQESKELESKCNRARKN